MPSDDKRVILVTGANKGIGYEAVKLLSHTLPQSTILLGTRSVDNGTKAIQKMKSEQSSHSFGNVKVLELDVTNTQSITKAVEHVKSQYGTLDVLLCNAGVAGGAGETPEQVFAVNIDGVHDMIEAFLPLIPANGLIDVVASEVGTWATHEMPPQLQKTLTSPETVNWPLIQQYESDWLKAKKGQQSEQSWPDTNKTTTGPYCVSKAFVIAYLRSFAAAHKQPKLVITCPGYCATDLNHNSGHRPASKGGESVVWPVLHQSEAESGEFYQDGAKQPFVAPVAEFAKAGFAKMDEMVAAGAKAKAQ